MQHAKSVTLPEPLDLATYRAQNPDIAAFDDAQLQTHYAQFGMAEGREASALVTRTDFASLIPKTADALEIGPFYCPMLKSRRTKYFDVLNQADLTARAVAIGIENPDVPKIDYQSPNGDLTVIDRTFDVVLSSHCIEHQPDLVLHLQQVQALLRPGGRYFLLVPDKRYCFDHFVPPSTIAEVMEAHHTGARLHSLRNVIVHRALTCHNDAARHWQGDHGTNTENQEARVRQALEEYQQHAGQYIDVHAWFFTPDSMTALLAALNALGLTDLAIERLYPTRRQTMEFWLVLRR